MTGLFSSRRLTFLALAAGLAACSSSTNSTTNGGPSCTDTTALTITFSPMYSGSDGVHLFQIPAVVSGVNTANVAWYVDPNVASLVPTNASQQTEGLGDVIVTTIDAGTTTVIAEVVSSDGGGTGVCGTSTLTVATYTPDDYDAGFTRYFQGVKITADGGCASYMALLNGQFSGAACSNCHEATGSLNYGPLTIATVAHTPEQTGGFSDTDLTNIIKNGQMPDANFFTGLDATGNVTGLTYAEWQQFHKWTFDSDAELNGVICYLRSLPPTPQLGSANFGRGGGRGDGGRTGGSRDGGFGGGDGGMFHCGFGPPGDGG